MKKVLFTILQFLLFIMTFAVGSFMVPFKIQSNLDHADHLAVTRYFIWDGLVLMFSLFIVILLIEIARKRLAAAAPWTTLALILATVVGIAMKLGFITREI
jgi:hypothetical protein